MGDCTGKGVDECLPALEQSQLFLHRTNLAKPLSDLSILPNHRWISNGVEAVTNDRFVQSDPSSFGDIEAEVDQDKGNHDQTQDMSLDAALRVV